MATRRKKTNSVKTQPRVRRRAKVQIKWGQHDWTMRLEEGLIRASFMFYMSQLEQRHGRGALSNHWMVECRDHLSFLGTVLLSLPLARNFDRRVVYRKAVRALKTSWSNPARELAHREYGRANKTLDHKLTERDTKAFFVCAAQALDFVLTPERKTERSPRSRKPQMRRSRA